MSKIFERAINKINKNINPDLAQQCSIPYQADSTAATVAALKEDYNALLAKIADAGLMSKLYTYPEAQATVVFGKAVSALQSANTKVYPGSEQGEIVGELEYVTDYTGYSTDPKFQKGNFLALHYDFPAGSTVKVGIFPSTGRSMIELDSDKNAVFRIINKDEQKVFAAFFDSNGKEIERFVYGLTGLTCDPAPTV